MWNALFWGRLQSSEIARQVEDFRKGSLQFLLAIAVIGHLLWHVVDTVLFPVEPDIPYRSLLPIVLAGQALSYLFLRVNMRLAALCFLTSSIVSITAAIWLLKTQTASLLYPIVALAAVVLLHPLAGLVTAAGSSGVVLILRQFGELTFFTDDRLIEVTIASLLTVATAWALDRNLIVAIEWSLQSYEQALRNAKEAQSHRAQLVQALRQLDNAYYRLERANAALEMAWKAAEAAERSKSEFVTNISHELRTPLNLILGFSEVIVTSPETYGVPLPAPYRRDLFAIYRSAQHLLTLTDDVLDLARIGAGRMALSREPVDLNQIIQDACDVIREYVAAKGLQLTIKVATESPVVNVDRLRVRQVLLNLLTNAARFTERGGITVSAAKTGEWVTVQVTDTGKGIVPEKLSQVFSEFYHDDDERERRLGQLGGTGLGLPISKRFVELHGGHMGVESTPGVGTTFWFTLPMFPTSEETSGATSAGPLRLPSHAGTGERILVVIDDDSRLAQFLQRHLRGYRVVAAPDIANGLATSVDLRATAVLADVDTLPVEHAATFPVPVVRLPLPRGERIAAELGVAAYLTKPVGRQTLRAAIEQLGRPIRTILVVDDDHSFVRLITLMCRTIAPSENCTVLSAYNGLEALRMMEAHRPDLVLLDLVMPEMDGEQVVAAMARDPGLADVPVIMLSSKDHPDWQFPLRGDISITKSDGFHLEELLGTVEAAVGALEPPRSYLTDVAQRPK